MNFVKPPGLDGQREYAAVPGLSELLLENFSDAVFANDVQTRVIEFWNRGAEALFGWAAEEALGKKPIALLGTMWAPGEDFESMLRTIRADGIWRGLVSLHLKSGHRQPFEVSVRLLVVDGAEKLVTVGRKAVLSAEAEAAVKASEANLRSIFDSARQVLYLVAPDYRVLAFNRAAEAEMLASQGHRLELGDDARLITTPSSRDQFIASFERCLRGESISVERRVEFPSGKVAWFEFDYNPVSTADGAILGVAFSARDVTSRKEEAEALWLRERAIEASRTGLVILTPNLPSAEVIYANPAFLSLTGYSANEVLGKNLGLLIGPDTDRADVARLRTAMLEGDACEVVIKCYRKNGSTFWNRASIAPLRNQSGVVTHYVAIQTDETAHRALEDQLRHAQKLEGIGRLAGGIAHDFNNLLTVILNSAELMELVPTGEAHELREEILFAGQRAAELTHQLLAFSRRQVLQPKVVDLGQALSSMGRMLSRVIREDISLRITSDGETGLVRVDPGQLEQVIMNLVVNARDAMPKGGVLSVETACVDLGSDEASWLGTPSGAYVRLTVADTGVGMSEATRQHIFEPFFTTKEVGKGTGMGLATVHGIVQQSGGFVDVESSPGAGTRFEVLLPRVHAPVESIEPRSTEIRGGTERILLVEDDEAVRKLASMILRRKGYTVLEAPSATEALNLFVTHPGDVDLLLSDLVMPGLNGLELAQRLRSVSGPIRVLFMSGYSYESVVEASVEHPPAMLSKPFTPETLAAKVREVLDADASLT